MSSPIPEHVWLFTDGGSRGNPGPAAAGVVIAHADTRRAIVERGYYLGKATNNHAEYMGLIRGLEACLELGVRRVSVFADSLLMIQQVNGEYRVKSPALKPLHERATALLARFGGWSAQHIARGLNTGADRLANLAMDRKEDVAFESPQWAPPIEGPGTGAVPGDSPTAAARARSEPRDEPRNEARAISARLEFRDASGLQCPHPHTSGQAFSLGPATPQGLCLHAAGAAIGALERGQAKASCKSCGATLTLRLDARRP